MAKSAACAGLEAGFCATASLPTHALRGISPWALGMYACSCWCAVLCAPMQLQCCYLASTEAVASSALRLQWRGTVCIWNVCIFAVVKSWKVVGFCIYSYRVTTHVRMCCCLTIRHATRPVHVKGAAMQAAEQPHTGGFAWTQPVLHPPCIHTTAKHYCYYYGLERADTVQASC